MIKKIDHIGIAVKSIDNTIELYSVIFGLGEPVIETVESQKVRTAMFTVGEVRIELLEPTAGDSPISNFLEKRGEGIHHIAFLTDDIEEQLDILKSRGIRLIHETPQPGTDGQKIAFIHPKSSFGVLTELCQMIRK